MGYAGYDKVYVDFNDSIAMWVHGHVHTPARSKCLKVVCPGSFYKGYFGVITMRSEQDISF